MRDDEEETYWPVVGGPFMRVTRWRDRPLKIVAVVKDDSGFEIETKEETHG